MRKIAFAPIVDDASKILLLGTMPSEESLRKQQYYGHKSNQFWKIIFALFDKPLSFDYQERTWLLLSQRIALWDVLSSCKGEGSADSDITEEQPNDFDLFFSKYSQIEHVFFTSLKAQAFYKKHIGLKEQMVYHILPSPSSANARLPLPQKIEKWRIVLQYI